MYISQDMYDVILQPHRDIHIKINLLNFQFVTVNEISGYALEVPKISEQASSDIRRTCDISICIKDQDFDVKAGGQMFLDKYIQIFVGIDNIKNGETIWFNKGIYLINQPTYEYDKTTNTLSFQGVDLMAKLTGMRNGNLEGITYMIKSGDDIRGVIISALKEAGFDKYIIDIEDGQELTPYEIKIESGGTVYDILSQIRDIYPMYQIYFDIDGVFHYELIPSGQDENIIADDTLWKSLMQKVTKNVDFESVKNVIEVWGAEHSTGQYHALIKDENPNSPFYVLGTTGEIRIVLSGEDYSVIPSDDLCMQRAEYELYLRARLNDTIVIECVPIYFLEVDKLISITLPNETIPTQYMIQSIDTGDIQSINCSKYYPLYPVIK